MSKKEITVSDAMPLTGKRYMAVVSTYDTLKEGEIVTVNISDTQKTAFVYRVVPYDNPTFDYNVYGIHFSWAKEEEESEDNKEQAEGDCNSKL